MLGFTEFGNRVTYSGVVDNEFALTAGKFAAHQYFPDVEHLKSLIVTPWQPMKRMPDRDELIAQFGDNNYPKVTLQTKTLNAIIMRREQLKMAKSDLMSSSI